MIILLLLDKLARIFFDSICVITSQNSKKELEKLFSQIWAILGSNYTVFIKFIGSILSKSRRTIIEYQLNSLLENFLKTQLVGDRWADVSGLRMRHHNLQHKKSAK